MINFKYKARDKYGVLTVGFMEAADSKTVAHRLNSFAFSPISIKKQENGNIFVKIETWLAAIQKIRPEEIIVFTRQLASVLNSGVPLLEGLDAVLHQVANRKFKSVILDIKREVEAGSSFSDALAKHPKVFLGMIINMVRAGEKAGILDEVLDRVSNLLEKDLDTVNKIKLATRYPSIVLGLLVLAFMVLTIAVIPNFERFFNFFTVPLPLPTRILIGIHKIVIGYWYIILLILLFSIYWIKKTLETEKGRYTFDRYFLSAPVIGPLFSRIYLSRFTRMLAAMLDSGIPILDSLKISAQTVGNRVISRVILDIENQISQGKSLTEPMQSSNIFPPLAVSMVAIGEKSGNLDEMLDKIADYFDREADYTIKNLTPLLEPALILCLAALVGLFALGIFLPMWDLIKIYQTF